jgi:hypothetical protein
VVVDGFHQGPFVCAGCVYGQELVISSGGSLGTRVADGLRPPRAGGAGIWATLPDE